MEYFHVEGDWPCGPLDAPLTNHTQCPGRDKNSLSSFLTTDRSALASVHMVYAGGLDRGALQPEGMSMELFTAKELITEPS